MLQRARAFAYSAAVLVAVSLPALTSMTAAVPAAGAAATVGTRRAGGVDDAPSTVLTLKAPPANAALAEAASATDPSTVRVDNSTNTIYLKAGSQQNNITVYVGYLTDPKTAAVIAGPFKYLRDETGTPIVPAAQTNGCVQSETVQNGATVAVPNQVACPVDDRAVVDLGDGNNGGLETSGKDCTTKKRKKCESAMPKMKPAPVPAPIVSETESASTVARPEQFIDFWDCLYGCDDSGYIDPWQDDWWGGGGGNGGRGNLDDWIRNPPPRPPSVPAVDVGNTFLGGNGNDLVNCTGTNGCLLSGGGGNDEIHPSWTGNDVVAGGPGDDTISQSYDARFSKPNQFDVIDGGDGNDKITNPTIGISFGGSGDDTLIGGGSLFGGSGADYLQVAWRPAKVNLIGGEGHDQLVGDSTGAIQSIAHFYDSTDTLGVRAQIGSTYGNDSIDDNVTGINGSDYGDNISGNAKDNSLDGGAGDDVINGGAGKDTLTGDSGADWMIGGDGKDKINGGGGPDSIDGGAGDDKLIGGAGDDGITGGLGADKINCSGGFDFANYTNSSTGVGVTIGGKGVSGDALGDKVDSSCEGLNGSSHNDILVGDAGSNTLNGRDGDDQIVAQGNNLTFDNVDCGNGNDKAIVDNAGWSNCETLKASDFSGPTTLAAIRLKESGSATPSYNKEPQTCDKITHKCTPCDECAGGAYQIVGATWRDWRVASGVPGAATIPYAWKATPAIQDAVADWARKKILAEHGNDLGQIPYRWYCGFYCTRGWGETPGTRNTETIGEYITKWLKGFDTLARSGMPARK